MLTIPVINNLLKLWNIRGQQLAQSINSLFQLVQGTQIDLSSLASAVVLLGQAYAQVQTTVGAVVLQDSIFNTFTIQQQDQFFTAYTNWLDFQALLGSVAFQENFPVLESILQPSAAARLFGANTANPSTINIKLESFLSVPTVIGITPNIFWQISTKAREELSSALTVDLTLAPLLLYGYSSSTSFLNSAIDILTNMIPLTVTPAVLTNQLNQAAAAGLQTTNFTSIKAISVPSNTTLAALSLIYTGSADNWEQIALQNNLTYPYITSDPVKALGTPYFSTVLLQTNLSSDSNTIIIGNIAGISQRCTILLQSGNFYDIMVVQSVGPVNIDNINQLVNNWDLFDNSGTIITETSTVNTYTAGNTIVSLYLNTLDQGNVLTTGDTILIPINQSATNNTTITSQNPNDPFGFGIDIQVNQGAPTVTNGDLTVITGVNNVAQAISNQFKTPQNTLVEHPQYGNNLETFIGLGNTPGYASLAQISAIQTTLSDPRTKTANTITTIANGDNLDIDLNVTLKNGANLNPLRLSTPVTFGAN